MLAAALFSLTAAAGVSSAASCNAFPSGSTPPQGYGAAWNVLSSAKELLVSSDCSANSVTVSVGSGNANQYIYKIRYYYSNSSKEWIETPLEGTFVSGSTDWLQGSGSVTGSLPAYSPFYWVGYVCQWTGNPAQGGAGWKCGCRDQACTENFWQLQAIVI